MEIAKIAVGSTTGSCLSRQRIPAGIVGATVSVSFTDPVWNDLEKTVVFRCDGSRIAKFDGKTAVIPWEIVKQPGSRLYFGIWGHNPATGLQIPLIEVYVGSLELSTNPGADPGADPSLPVWEQLEDRLNEEINHVSTDIKKLNQDIEKIRDDMNYKPIDITGISNNVGTVEIGVVVSEMTVSWSVNKTPASQTLGGEAVDVNERSKTVSMEGRTSVKLEVTDERGAKDSASTGYNSYNGVYYGVLEDGAVIDSAAILRLAKKLQSSRNITFTVKPESTQRIAFAIPTGYGTPTFKDAGTGFQADMTLAKQNLAFVNAHGYETTYNVWLSTNIVPGSITVAVT